MTKTIRELIDLGVITMDTKVMGNLPVTADKVIVMPGETVYHPDDPSLEYTVRDWESHDDAFDFPLDTSWPATWYEADTETGYHVSHNRGVQECYSTPESAAAAARKEGV